MNGSNKALSPQPKQPCLQEKLKMLITFLGQPGSYSKDMELWGRKVVIG